MHSTSRFTQQHMYYTQKHLRQTKWAQRKGETLRVHFAWGQPSKSTTGASSRNKGKLALLLQEALLLSLSHSFPPTCWHKGGKPTSIKIWQKKKKGGGEFSFNPHQSLDWVYHTESSVNKGGKNCQKENCFLSRSASLPHVKLLLEELYKRSTGMIQYLDDFVLNLTYRTLCTLNLRT